MSPIETGGLEGLERNARSRHKTRLDAGGRPGETHVAASLLEHLRKRERRIDMTGGPAAGKHDEHRTTSWSAEAIADDLHAPARGVAHRRGPIARCADPRACGRRYWERRPHATRTAPDPP